MTEQPIEQKCRFCGAETVGSGVCHKCLDNTARQKMYKDIEELEAKEFSYAICPIEGHLLRVLEYDEKGKAAKYFCPECQKETTELLFRKYNPTPHSYKMPNPETNKYDEIKPQTIADDVKANYLFITDRTTKIVYRYDEDRQLWRDDGAIYLQELLPKILGFRNSEAIYKNVLHCLRSITYEEIKPSKNVLATSNGLLDPEKRKLVPFTPNEFVLQKIPHKFDPEAKCPNILKVVTEIVGENQLRVLQEAIGNIFIRGMPFAKITIFIGSGANGKGQVLSLITHLVGLENTSNVTLQALCYDKYERATCYRKMVNLGRDIPQTKLESTGNPKMMSGDDPMTMQHKYGHPFVATPEDLPKQFYSCNQLPPSSDDTDAWYRRQNLLSFNVKFIPGVNAILKIADKLAESESEMSGFLNWALEGTARLRENGRFSANEDIEENREKYVKNSNPSQAYIEANLVHEENKFIPEKELWSKVGVWCSENSIASPRNKGTFTQELTKIIPCVVQTTARVEGKVTHVYMNVKYKERDKTQPPLNGFSDQDVTTVTTVTTIPILPESENNQKIKSNSQPVTPVTPVTDKPVLNVYHVHDGGPCGCGLFAVEFELYDTVEDTRKSYCASCAKGEKKWFLEHGYQIVYPSSSEEAS